jgi:predicted ATPase/DNA-binding CsgD family transcriptional regulator
MLESATACAPPVPVLRGRDRQLGAIGEAVAAVARGTGGTLVVEGPPGIGKSSLLGEARAMAQRTGVQSLFGEAVDPRFWSLHDLQAALESRAREAPLTLVLDDLQWADAGTLTALSLLPARLVDVPILWILARRRAESRPPLDDAVARLERDGARRLQLDPLAEDAVAAVVADRVDGEADPTLLDLAAHAHGNPLLLVDLLEGLREEGRLGRARGRTFAVGDGVPRRLAESMRRRLDRLSDDARQVVRVASLLGHRFTVEQLATMLQRRPSTLVAALDEALRADLLAECGEELRFGHELLRQAVRETLPRSLRRALRREAAAMLLAVGATPVEVARQLTGGPAAGEPEGPTAADDDARPVRGWASLTDAELRVAYLVAGGATNRDAAEQLFLSPHTVSSHVRSAFAKLGINSRIELARIVLTEEPDAIRPPAPRRPRR